MSYKIREAPVIGVIGASKPTMRCASHVGLDGFNIPILSLLQAPAINAVCLYVISSDGLGG